QQDRCTRGCLLRATPGPEASLLSLKMRMLGALLALSSVRPSAGAGELPGSGRRCP
ncbi:hypothetical protein P7K49_010437, partial [Saguinus oedipus]